MATLTGNKIKDSYLGLLKSISNGAISSSFVQISDGGGNALPLYLSTSSIKFYNAYTFPSADGTISGQVLSTDASGTLSWVTSSDNQTLQEVLTQGNTTDLEITTSAQFNGDINGALLQKVKAAEALSKGDVVYISGGTGDNPEVSKANASDSTKMPALGIMKENLNNINDEGECITSGELTGVDLTGIATGAELFVSSATAGELVTTAPTGVANLIQKIGKVIKGGNGGALTVLGAFRTNAMPNLPTGILLGDTTNVATAITDGSSGQILSTDGNGTYSFIDDNAITSAVSPLNLSANQISLGTVPVTKGGTGATTLTGILLGNATSAISGITSAVDGHVLTADGNGGYAFEVASGDVSISGTPTANQIAIWTDGSTIKGMSALEIDTNDKITLDQDASSYNIGGGNIANVTGISNTGFGLDNLNAVTTGNRNVAFGYYSLKNLTIGTDNVAIGYAALQDVTEAIKCVAIGSEALNSVTTGHFNVAVGHTAGSYVSTSTRNTLVGYGAGNQLDTTGTPSGGYNTFIGYQSGGLVTTGSKNVVIGSNEDFVDGLNNYIVISDGDGNVRMYFDNNGQLNVFSEISLRDSSATNNPLMFQIQRASYTASSPYNTNKLVALNNSNISFQTGSTDALFIEGTTGNVGIGTSSTEGKLTLSYTASELPNSGTTSNSAIQIISSLNNQLNIGLNTVSGSYGSYIQASDNNLAVPYPLNLQPNGGNVGIGTTSPLTINGNAAAGSGLHVNASSGYGVSILDGADGSQMFFNDRGASVNSRLWRLLCNDGSFSINAMNDNIGVKSSALTISSTGAATFSSSAHQENLIINDVGNNEGGIRITTSTGTYYHEIRGNGDGLYIGADDNSQGGSGADIKFLVKGSQKMRITSGGKIQMGSIRDGATLNIKASGTQVYNGLNVFRQSDEQNWIYASHTGSKAVLGESYLGSASYNPLVLQTSEQDRLTISTGGDATFSGSAGDVNSDISNGNLVRLNGGSITTAGHGVGIRFERTGSQLGFIVSGRENTTNEASFLSFATQTSAGAHPEAMRISSYGIVLFGRQGVPISSSGTRIDATGESYNSITNSINTLHIYDVTNSIYRFYVSGSGQINATSTSISGISDISLKENIKPLETGLDEVIKLQPKRFDWKNGDGKNIAGFVAQEVEEILPDLVSKINYNATEKKKAIKMGDMIPTLVNAIQEQQTIIEDLKARIETLEG